MLIWKKYLSHPKANIKKLEDYGKKLHMDAKKLHEKYRVHIEYIHQSSLEKINIEEHTDLKNAILEAALLVYSKAGFRGLTVEAVAKTSGLKTSEILKFFKNKNMLIESIFSSLDIKFSEYCQNYLFKVAGTPQEKLQLFCDRSFQLAESDSISYKLQCWGALEGPHYINKTLSGSVSICIQFLAHIIQEAQPQISRVESEARASALFGLLDQYKWIYWYYINHMTLQSDSAIYLQHLKNVIRTKTIETCLSPSRV